MKKKYLYGWVFSLFKTTHSCARHLGTLKASHFRRNALGMNNHISFTALFSSFFWYFFFSVSYNEPEKLLTLYIAIKSFVFTNFIREHERKFVEMMLAAWGAFWGAHFWVILKILQWYWGISIGYSLIFFIYEWFCTIL